VISTGIRLCPYEVVSLLLKGPLPTDQPLRFGIDLYEMAAGVKAFSGAI